MSSKGVLKIAEVKDKLELAQPVFQDEQAAASLRLSLQTICDVIVTKLGYEAASIGLNDEMITQAKHTSEKMCEESLSPETSLGEGAPENRDGASNAGCLSAISFPLKIGNVAIGTLRVHSDKQDALGPQEEKILEVFSDTAAFAVEKANVSVAGLSVFSTRRSARQLFKKSLDPGEVYVFRGGLDELLQLFRSHLESGWSGLLICGRSTDRIIGVEQLGTVPTFEITGDASQFNAIWSYSGLTTLVSSFIRATEKPLVVVDRLEKLEDSPQKGHLGVFVGDLRKEVREVNGIVVIRMESIENRWLGTLEKSCRFL